MVNSILLDKLKKIFGLSNPEIVLFDDMNKEVRSMAVYHSDGCRFDLSKSVPLGIQLGTSMHFLGHDRNYQLAALVGVSDNSSIQLTLDHNGAAELTLSGRKFGTSFKFQTIHSKIAGSFLQVNVTSAIRDIGIGAKFIDGCSNEKLLVLSASSRIKKSLVAGIESVFTGKEVGVGLALRKESKDNVYVVSLHQFSSMGLSIYKKIGKFFSISADFGYSLTENSVCGGFGYKIEGNRYGIKTYISTSGKAVTNAQCRFGMGNTMSLTIGGDVMESNTKVGVGVGFDI